jgi:dTDP-4-dehydrorhamnose 3,5-epimerase
MVFKETPLQGAYLIEMEPLEDERGFFARTFCQEEFRKRSLNPTIAQCNVSYNRTRGTLRGLHYQVAPHSEAKVVACLRGAIYDVIVDLRPDSATYLQWLAFDLRGGERFSMLYIPEGFAHGFQTREDHTEVFYQMSASYHPASARGLRWNDPAFGIKWPEDNRVISEKDQSYPDFVR